MDKRIKDKLEDILTEAISSVINSTKVTISGRVLKKENDGMMIIIETDHGNHVKVDINDGITDDNVFSVGDIITDLPLQGAYFNLKNTEVILTFVTRS